jgi:glycosyltransferase involved in cell wall biosynthesis
VRILAVTNLYPSPHQPHRASFNRRQFAALALDHEVRVIAPIAWTSAVTRQTPRMNDGITVHHPRYLYTPKILRSLYGHFFEQSIGPCFEAQVSEFRPDVVLGCWAYPDGWAAVRLAREAGLPVALKVHGSDILTLRDDARLARTAEALRSADAVIAVSNGLRERVIELGAPPARTHLVHNGIDSSIFHPGPRAESRRLLCVEEGDPLVLFVGNLVHVKGLDILIDALARLRAADVRFRCVCVGQGAMSRDLHARVARHSLTPHVQFLPPCRQEQLALWYRAADLLVLPSRSEGTPNVLLEAAACGTPFIAANVGGVPDLCDPAALVPAEDPEALADRIRTFLNPATRPTLSAKFTPGTWRDSANALASVLEQIAVRKQSALAA